MIENTWHPVDGHLMTPWAEQVDPDCPLPEYPRPMMTRERWLNLNGVWNYAVIDREAASVPSWDGNILVPFPIESALSGVKRPLLPSQRLWYRRQFEIPVGWSGERVVLHFGAVDFEAEVWVNEVKVGDHRGGYLPFSFDISAAMVDGVNFLTVAVWDPSDAGMQERGKQVLEPGGIWYTAVSGIWQTVWIEPVPAASIRSLRITPDLDQAQAQVQVEVDGDATGLAVRVELPTSPRGLAAQAAPGEGITLAIPDPHAWSPEDPYLYPLKVSLWLGDRCVDAVASYFALRKISLAPDKNGRPRVCLNNRPLFLYGPLDQGYYPDGLYTAPTEAAMLNDIDLARRLGFNFIRKHVKVEPQRWYAHCDRTGMLVWQDMPNGGKAVNTTTSTLAMHFGLRHRDDRNFASAGRQDEANRRQYHTDLIGMVDALGNHPCIIIWVPFNEAWGQFNARTVGAELKQRDPTRLVDATSGWFDQGGGDFLSQHQYVLKLRAPKRADRRAFILSEIGGYSRQEPGHLWDQEKKYGYRFYPSSQDLTDAYIELIREQLQPLIAKGLAGAVYTETTDVESEVNGFVTYDRLVEKMDLEKVAAVHRELLAAGEDHSQR